VGCALWRIGGEEAKMSISQQPAAPIRPDGRPRWAMRILLVEDNIQFARSVANALARIGYVPIRVTRGADALTRHHDADLVLLDLLLPDCDDLKVLRKLRQVTDIPILVLTAVDDFHMVVRALHLGADDYLVKPVRQAELLARIKAVARRSQIRPERPPRTVVAADVEIDLAARRVSADEAQIALTNTEFDILAALARHHGLSVSREQLMNEVWGGADPARTRALGVHMTSLRKKLDRPGLITTIHGYGYRLEG
jgi:DNA-binding response OmpR family regulator